MAVSKLIQDLDTVPGIIGNLGRNIAEAQQLLNADYLSNIKQLISLILTTKDQLPKSEQNAAFVENMLIALAPSRYQFTSTNLSVRMDLASNTSVGAAAGASGSIGAVTVSGSLSVAYGREYRAAAEVATVLQAIPADAAVFKPLLDAKKPDGVDLPPAQGVNKTISDQTTEIMKLLSAKSDSDDAGT